MALQLVPPSLLLNSPPKPAAYTALPESIAKAAIQQPGPKSSLVRIQVAPPSVLLDTPFWKLGTITRAYKILGLPGSIAREVIMDWAIGAEVASLQVPALSRLLNTRVSQAGGGSLPLWSH